MIANKTHLLSYLSLLTACLWVVLIGGCAQENPLLYDPSMRDSSVSVRYVNMSNDGITRTFSISGNSDFTDIPFGTTSDLRVNTIDSAHYSILRNGNIEYSTLLLQKQKLSFFRNTIQTFISMNDGKSDSTRIIQLSTFRTDALKGKAKVRVINTISDNQSYNVFLGCEQGKNIAEGLSSGQVSADIPINPSSNSITITRASDKVVIGTFDNSSFSFEADSIYSIIIGKETQSTDTKVLVLNEFRSSQDNSIITFNKAVGLSSQIVLYNLSKVPVDVELKQSGKTSIISSNTTPKTSTISKIDACTSSGVTTLIIKQSNGKILSEESIDLSPYNSYSCVFIENAFSANGFSLCISEQSKSPIALNHVALKTLITGFPQSITINTSARSVNNQFESGSILFENLFNGVYSNEIGIKSGIVPILVQTSSTPQKLLNQFIGTLPSDKHHILIATPDEFFSLEEETGTISSFEQGAITQIIHGGTNSLKPLVSIGNIVQNIPLLSDGIITTVLPINRTTNVVSGNKSISVTATNPKQRYCYIIDEDQAILDYSYNSTLIDKNLTKIRLINLSPNTIADLYLDYDIRLYYINNTDSAKVIEIRNANRDFYSQIRGIVYKQSSDYITIDRERRLSFSLLRWQDPPLIYAALNNVLISLGKNYCILLVPDTDGKQRTIIRQEY